MMTQVISMQISDPKCACLSVCLRMYVHIYLSIHLSVFLPNTLNQMQKLQDKKWCLTHVKRSSNLHKGSELHDFDPQPSSTH